VNDGRRLIDDYLDGEMTPETEKQLVEWLAADPEHVRMFVRESHAHRSLRDLLVARKMQSSLREEAEDRSGRRTPRPFRFFRASSRPAFPWIVAAAAAAALLVAALVLPLLRRPGGPPAPPTAREVRPPEPVEVPRPGEAVKAPPGERQPSPESRKEPGPAREPGVAPPPERPPAPVPPESRLPVPPVAPPAEVPPDPPAEPARRTVALVAEIRGLRGEAFVLTGAEREPARAGQPLLPGQGIATTGPEGAASLRLPDGTRVELGAETSVREISERPGGKTVAVEAGTLVFATPHAEARVLGTQLALSVSAQSTRLEVREGRVRFTRLPDGAAVEVGAGRFAVAAPGPAPASRPLPQVVVTRSFQDGVSPAPSYSGTRDATLSDGAPSSNFGAEKTVRADGSDKRVHLAALLKWDLSDIPPGSRVLSAQIELNIVSTCKGQPYRFHEVRIPWEEGEATWKNRDANFPWQVAGARGGLDRGTAVLATLAPYEKGEHTVLLNGPGLQAVQGWINYPSANNGFVIVSPGNPDGVDFSSREASTPAQRPKLRVTYVPAEKR